MSAILVCTLGGSWAVIPEVYAFLAPERLPLYRDHPQTNELAALRREQALAAPDEIWVCTTQGAKTREGLAALLGWHCRLPAAPALRIWQADGTDELAHQDECEHMRELISRVCLLAHTRAEGGQVVLSLAGGRKTMSADLQWAGSLLGCDALVHVVGCDPLPDALTKELTVERMLAPLPASLCSAVVPLIVGRGTRSELLDIALEGREPITAAAFPIGLPDSRCPLAWPAPSSGWLSRELQRREREGSQLLGNFLSALSQSERHENWRSLYRLPPRLIDRLRNTPLAVEHQDWLLRLPKADLHRHVGGCLDIPGQMTVGRAIWEAMSRHERQAARALVDPLLAQRDSPWAWDWPSQLMAHGVPRAHAAAALLTAADESTLEANLFATTEPRVALKHRHTRGFAAYERPGELSGSALLTHPAAIDPYARLIVRQAVAEGLAYVELRGSPQKYGDGLAFLHRFSQAIDAALASMPKDHRPQFRFIVIGDRRQRDSLKAVIGLTVRAKRELPDFVVGLDLAGDEGTASPETIAPHFLPAFEACLPVTIHAGEGEAADSIWQAAYHLHADRIGHGLTIVNHADLAKRFRDRGICLELCPSSNREVVGFHDPVYLESQTCDVYPLWSLWQAGLPLTLCTDNPGMSRTTLAKEFLVAARMVGAGGNHLTRWDTLAIIKQGFVHAFLPSEEKERLLKDVDAYIYRQLVSE